MAKDDIKEHDIVRIKKNGIVGEVVDVHATSDGSVVYTVEYEADPWDISICEHDEIELIIHSAQIAAGGEFSEKILAELVDEGLTGTELLEEFKRRQAQIRPAAEKMLAKAEDIAAGRAEYENYGDVFCGGQPSG